MNPERFKRPVVNTKIGLKILNKRRKDLYPSTCLLHEAAAAGNEVVCRSLIEDHGWSVNALGQVSSIGFEDEITPLAAAVHRGHIDLASLLVDQWKAKTDNHVALLSAACTQPWPDMIFPTIMKMVKEWRVDINAKTSDGDGLVHFIPWAKMSADQTDQLLLSGLDPSMRDARERTLPHRVIADSPQRAEPLYGTERGFMQLRRLLRTGRLDINQTDHESWTALHAMAIYGDSRQHAVAVKHLLDLGADRTLKTDELETPLSVTSRCRPHPDVVDIVEHYAIVPLNVPAWMAVRGLSK